MSRTTYKVGGCSRNGAVKGKVAGAGGGGTIIVLTFDPERTKVCSASKLEQIALLSTSDPNAQGVTMEYAEEFGYQEAAPEKEN